LRIRSFKIGRRLSLNAIRAQAARPARPDELVEREARIERAQRNAYYEIGLELAAIRDKKLYRAEFATFEEYVGTRWELQAKSAYRLIDASEFARKCPIGHIPQRESHIRPLLEKLDNDKDREHVWSRVVARHERITAAMVENECEQFKAAAAQDWITLEIGDRAVWTGQDGFP